MIILLYFLVVALFYIGLRVMELRGFSDTPDAAIQTFVGRIMCFVWPLTIVLAIIMGIFMGAAYVCDKIAKFIVKKVEQ